MAPSFTTCKKETTSHSSESIQIKDCTHVYNVREVASHVKVVFFVHLHECLTQIILFACVCVCVCVCMFVYVSVCEYVSSLPIRFSCRASDK